MGRWKWPEVLDDVHAGVVLFLTASYLLFIIPSILTHAGLSFEEAFTATAFAIGVPTLLGAYLTKRPFLFGPGVALTAYLVFNVVQQEGISYDVALAAVVVEGIILLALSISNLREMVAKAFPKSLINGALAGIGLYLVFLGFHGSGMLVDGKVVFNPQSMVAMGVLLAAILLYLRGIWGSFLLAIILGYGMALLAGLASPPMLSLSPPTFPSHGPNFFGTDSFALFSIVLAILLIDFFDTLGVSTAILMRMERGIKKIKEVFLGDAVGTLFSGFIGAPSVAAYVESSVAVDKVRGPVPAYTAGILFITAAFFSSAFEVVPYYISAPILVIIGSLMFSTLKPIDKAPDELIPMVVTTSLIPLTQSIAMGIMAGIFFYIATKFLLGKAKEVHPVLIITAVLIILDIVNAI